MSSRSERASSSAISEARPCSANGFRPQHPASRKGEQLPDQTLPAVGDAQNGRRSPSRRLVRGTVAQQRRVAYHHGQQIVEIVGDTSDQVADRFELLRLVQSRLGRPMFGHFGLQMEIGFGQAKIDLFQFEAQPERLCEDFAEVPSCQRQRRHEHNDHRRKHAVCGRPLRDKKRKAIGRPFGSRKARSDGRCDALIAMAPADMPPITMMRKS